MYLVVALYGFFPALTDGIGKSMVSAVVPKSSHGRAQGIFQSLSGMSILVAGLWGGALWGLGSGSGSLPMTIAGALAGLMSIGFFIFGKSPLFAESSIDSALTDE
jgi:MFS family permease